MYGGGVEAKFPFEEGEDTRLEVVLFRLSCAPFHIKDVRSTLYGQFRSTFVLKVGTVEQNAVAIATRGLDAFNGDQ